VLKSLAYENFDIRFERSPQDAVWRVIAESTQGAASGAFHPPGANGEATEVLANAPWAEAGALKQYGTALYDALFTADLRALFLSSFSAAKGGGKGLRLRVRADVGVLSRLPWELLWRSDIDVPLASSEWHPVVRFIQLPFATRPLSIDGRLRVLLVSAVPTDQDTLDVEGEADEIARALSTLSSHVEILRLREATKIELFRAIGDSCHVVHFMLHGRLDGANEGELMLRAADGTSDPLSASDLRRLAHDWALRGTRLLVFNACETARDRAGQDFSGIAPAAVQAGIPAVISMQYPITDMAAGIFSNELYREVAQGSSVDQAVSKARQLVQLLVKDGHEWVTPVLHMRATEGVLFEGTAAPIVRVGLEADAPAQRALTATTRRSAQPAATASELVVRVGRGRVSVRSDAGSAEVTAGDLPPIAAAYLEALRGSAVEPDTLKALGDQLYAAVFRGEAESILNRALSQASAGVAVRILLEDAREVGLPWESLFHPRRRTFLALAGAQRPMRLELCSCDLIRPAAIAKPVRMLFVGSRPLDMPPLDVERELNWLQTALKDSPDQIEIDVLLDPTPQEWVAKLSGADYHILHFAGYDTHAYSNFRHDEGVMLLGAHGERRDVFKDDLVQLLQGFPQLRLAVFNTCFTTDALAPALIQCGVPSVIAWRGFNLDAVAVRFTSVFYALLVKLHWRVDAALAETRRILYAESIPGAPAPWHGPALLTSIEGNDFFGM
jgi:CHAT domain-containing protein